jgi:DNA-binding MarR family transcriptional regulator
LNSSTTEPTGTDLRDLFVAVLQVSKVIQAGLSAELESALGLTLGEIDVLANLSMASDGRLRLGQISDLLIVNRTAVTRLIDSLESNGLVERQAFAGDRRGVYAVITGAGRGAFAEGEPVILAGLARQIGDAMTSDEVVAIRAAFARILGGLGVGGTACGGDEAAPSAATPATAAVSQDGA